MKLITLFDKLPIERKSEAVDVEALVPLLQKTSDKKQKSCVSFRHF